MTGTRWGRAGIAALTAAVLATAVLGPGTAVAGAGAPRARAVPAIPFDLNGDGYAELVIGVPGEAIGRISGAGAVNIIDGSAGGVTGVGNRMIHQGTPGVAGSNETGDHFGSTVASADFDRDGFADLAVGAVGENRRGSSTPSGAVTVLYGSAHGPKGLGDQFLRPQDLHLPDAWGDVLETGDLNGDGYADLVVAGAGPASAGHGGVTVLYGSSRGLTLLGAVHLTDALAGAPGPPAARDRFGRAAAVGDVTGDGIDDLVVGTSRDERGGVYLFGGQHARLSTTAAQFVGQDSPDLVTPDVVYSSDGLGRAVAVGDFDGDGHGDVAVGDADGEPQMFRGCQEDGGCPGMVLVLPGSDAGMDAVRHQVLSQEPVGSAGGDEALGSTLRAGDLDLDGHDDLVISGSRAVLPNHQQAVDSVIALYGTDSGLSGSGSQEWAADTLGIPGVSTPGDGFGDQLRISQLGRSAAPELVISVTGQDSGATRHTGAVTVLYGSDDSGPVATGSQQWAQGHRGVVGVPESGDRFGALGR
ncbi:MAG: hypothetical protein ABI776_11075 [Nocardioidaceae bacterium]